MQTLIFEACEIDSRRNSIGDNFRVDLVRVSYTALKWVRELAVRIWACCKRAAQTPVAWAMTRQTHRRTVALRIQGFVRLRFKGAFPFCRRFRDNRRRFIRIVLSQNLLLLC